MLPKRNRIPIQTVRRANGRIYRAPHLIVKIIHSHARTTRFGVVIATRFVGTAARRNQLKRRIFLFFKTFINKLPSADYLVIITAPISIPGDIMVIENELTTALRHIL